LTTGEVCDPESETLFRPEAIREILDCLGLPSRAPPIARAVPEDADEPDI